MENGPPPLPRENVPFVTLAGAIGLLLSAVSAAAASWLISGSEEIANPLRPAIAIGGAAVALCGVGASFVAAKRTAVQRTVFGIALLLGAGAIAFEVQAMVEPAAKFIGAASRAVRISSQRKVDPVAIASAPIPQVDGALTRDSIEPFYRSWIEEKMRAGYQAHGSHDPRWDAVAPDFVCGVIVARLGLRGAPTAAQIETWARELEHDGCDDPLVLAALATRKQTAKARDALVSQAAEGLKARGYAPGLLFLTRAELWALRRKTNPHEAGAVAAQAVDALKEEFAAAPLTERDYWVWNYFLINDAPSQLMETNGDAVLATLDPLPTVEPWFKRRLRGEIEIAKAWAARSNAYANEVTQAGWTGFDQHLALAREELTESWKLHPQHPAAAQLMITVAMGHSDSPATEMRQWFDRAASARLDYMSAYKSMLWGLRPRWHGSERAVLAFGRACAATKRYDTAVPWEYFVATRDAASDWDQPDTFYLQAAPYAELRELCLAYARDPKAPETPSFYLSHLALLAAACEHRDDVIDALKQVDFKVDPAVAVEWRCDPVQMPGGYLARSGTIAAPVREAEQAAQRGEFTAAIETLRKAEATPNLDPASKAFTDSWIGALEKLQPIERTPWEPFLPPPGGAPEWQKAGWIGVSGRWSQPDPQTLELESDNTTETLLHSSTPPGSTYELRGEIEHATDGAKVSSAAITMGWPEDKRDVWLTVRFRRTAQKGDAVVFAHAMGNDRVFPAPKSSGPIKFLVRVVGRHVTVMMNGTPVMDTDFRPPGDVSGQPPVLGFGAPRSDQPVKIRFRNVEWRRLSAAK